MSSTPRGHIASKLTSQHIVLDRTKVGNKYLVETPQFRV